MSASELLESLRTHNLEVFYPNLYTKGVTNVSELIEKSSPNFIRSLRMNSKDAQALQTLVEQLKINMEQRGRSMEKSRLPVSSERSRSRSESPFGSPAMRVAIVHSPASSPLAQGSMRGKAWTRSLSRGRVEVRMEAALPCSLPNSPKSSPKVRLASPSNSPKIAPKPAPNVSRIPGKTASPKLSSPKLVPKVASPKILPKVSSPRVSSPKVASPKLSTPPMKSRKIAGPTITTRTPLTNAYGIPLSAVKNSPITPKKITGDRINVIVRKRPLNGRECHRRERDVVEVSGNVVTIHQPITRLDLVKVSQPHSFKFDAVFDETVQNSVIHEKMCLPLLKHALQGKTAAVFAYGQTGSGKSHTLYHLTDGLVILAARHLLSQAEGVFLSFFEIYGNNLHDLLNDKQKVFAREDGQGSIVVKSKEVSVTSLAEVIQVFDQGLTCRASGSTSANQASSRSHGVFVFRMANGGRISYLDLAGSERGADRGEINNKTRLEGCEINKSLLALKECIRAMDQGTSNHTPFRQSKLTMVLRDALVGDGKTCMISTVSPGACDVEHTLNTLRYADRVADLKERGEELDRQDSLYDEELPDHLNDPMIISSPEKPKIQLTETVVESWTHVHHFIDHHKSHLKEIQEIATTETRLLQTFSLKISMNSGDVRQDLIRYVDEVEAGLERKLQHILTLREKLSALRNC